MIFGLFKRRQSNVQSQVRGQMPLLTLSQTRRLHLTSAFKRISTYGSWLIPDPLRNEDLKNVLEQQHSELITLISNEYIQPAKRTTLNMPKKGYSFRPLSYLMPIDNLIYQAIVDQIIRYKRSHFSEHVYSEKLNEITENEIFKNPVTHWIKMIKKLKYLYGWRAYTHYFNTDIAAYFENIKLEKLQESLSFFVGRKEQDFIEPLNKMLKQWCYAFSQGLVQTHPASSILGKIYLTSIDSYFGHIRERYSRYVDEFHIMAKDEAEIYENNILLIEKLRDLGLNINASKSKILRGTEIHQELYAEEKYFEGVSYAAIFHLKDKRRTIIEAKLKEYAQKMRKKEQINLRVARSLLKNLTQTRSIRGATVMIRLLRLYPEQTLDIYRYLKLIINSSLFVRNFIVRYEQEAKVMLNDWEHYLTLALILEIDDEKLIDLQRMRKLVMDKNKNPFVRSAAILIYSKNQTPQNLMFLVDLYRNENDLIVRRTLLGIMSALPKFYTKDVYRTSANEDLNIQITCLGFKDKELNLKKHRIL